MKNNDLGFLILRLTVGVLMLFHGINKMVFGISGITLMIESKGLPAILSYGVYVGEVLAPILIIIGWRTRLASIVLLINMIFAVFVANPSSLLELTQHGAWASELGAFYLFLSVVLFFTGAGKYSLSSKSKWD